MRKEGKAVSQYTTGEMAKACGITVRTVQFYDQRGLLIPSALTEGGRRLYSEEDLKKMKIICFLRDTGLSLDTIGQLMKEEDPGSVISIMLEQQEQVLKDEIAARQEKLNRLNELKKGLKTVSSFSLETIGDIAALMENKKKLDNLYRTVFLIAIPLLILQWASILLWILKGVWQPFVVWFAAAIPYGILVTLRVHRNVAYICPQCHEVFRPPLKEQMLAKHTRKTRRLTCVRCGHHGFCVETWGGDMK